MDKIVKKSIKMLWVHILAVFLAFFLMVALAWLIEMSGLFIYSIITSIIYFGMMYCEAWEIGRVEGKPYSEITPTFKRAFFLSIPTLVIGIILILVVFINKDWGNMLLRVYLSPFIGFFGQDSTILWWQALLPLVASAVLVISGYLVGTKQFSIIDELLKKLNLHNKKSLKSKKERDEMERAEVIKKIYKKDE